MRRALFETARGIRRQVARGDAVHQPVGVEVAAGRLVGRGRVEEDVLLDAALRVGDRLATVHGQVVGDGFEPLAERNSPELRRDDDPLAHVTEPISQEVLRVLFARRLRRFVPPLPACDVGDPVERLALRSKDRSGSACAWSCHHFLPFFLRDCCRQRRTPTKFLRRGEQYRGAVAPHRRFCFGGGSHCACASRSRRWRTTMPEVIDRIRCADCGALFFFSPSEQELFAERCWPPPKRCLARSVGDGGGASIWASVVTGANV